MCVFMMFTLLDLEPPFDYSMFAFSAPSLLGLCLFILFSLSLFTLPCLDLSMFFFFFLVCVRQKKDTTSLPSILLTPIDRSSPHR